MFPSSNWLVCTELRWFRVWLACGICLITVVFYFSLAPPSTMPSEHHDKLYHAAAYALLMAWFVQLYRGWRGHLLLAAGFVSMGAGIELLQSLHPMRYFDVLDMLANAAGVSIVWVFTRGTLPDLLSRFEQWVGVVRQ